MTLIAGFNQGTSLGQLTYKKYRDDWNERILSSNNSYLLAPFRM